MQKLLKVSTLFILAFLFSFNSYGTSGETYVLSPNGNLKFSVFLSGKQLVYSVMLKDKLLMGPSPFVMTVEDENICQLSYIGDHEVSKENITYPWLGLNATANSKYNGQKITLRTKAGTEYTLEVRVFNDAVAFQFEVPGIPNSFRTPDESTVFTFPAGSTAWYHDLSQHYKGVYTKNAVETIPAGQWAAPVVTVKLPEGLGYAAITEADLKNYPGMALQTDGKRGFVMRLAHKEPVSKQLESHYSKEDVARLTGTGFVVGTITTPWRVVMISPDLNKLVNNDAIHNLCPLVDSTLFPQGSKSEWIKPGRAIRKSLDGSGDPSVANMKKVAGAASDLGFEYTILDASWSKCSDDSLRDLVKYSNDKKVGIFAWADAKNLRDSVIRHQLFRRCKALGVTGLKIDHFDNEGKETIDLYNAIIEETAYQHLLIIFNGSNKPTGQEHTWPNIMAYEGVKGMESADAMDLATHETTLPFTRMLAGPLDYSVIQFGAGRQNTTWAHQVATAAILSAPITTYAATAATLLANPAADMIKSIPSSWDETKVLEPSEIGELAIFAQRKGTTWFLSVINGVSPKSLKIPLSFLNSGTYQSMQVSDVKDNPAAVKVENNPLKKSDEISLELGVGGGYIARFIKK
jgi:alpha-glucosidase